MKIKTPFIIASLLGVMSSQFVFANEYCGYSRSSANDIVVSSDGKCVVTDRWAPNKHVAEKACHPKFFPVKAPTPPPMPMHVDEPEPELMIAIPEVSAPVEITYHTETLASDTFFDTGSARLKMTGKEKLDNLANKISNFARLNNVLTVGHTDSRGSERHNQGLSERRALSVKQYLVNHGIDANMIFTEGRGELEPVADNSTENGRSANRRVEILIGVEAAN